MSGQPNKPHTGEREMLQVNSTPAIKSVRTLSTGMGAQHEEHRYGSWKPALWWIFASKSWVEIPILVYVIEHRDGLVLFDAGMDRAAVTDPRYVENPITRLFQRNLFQLEIGPAETLANKLQELGYNTADVRTAAVSHLHFDHVGCIKEIPQAELLVSEAEWKQLDEPHPERDFFLQKHIQLPGAKWRQIEFQPTDDPVLGAFGECFDVMGDGSMVLLPTPGHTAGSMSMLVRSVSTPPMLMVGDLTYAPESLHKDQLPGTGDKELLLQSYAKVRALKEQLPDLVILPCHDIEAAQKVSAIFGE